MAPTLRGKPKHASIPAASAAAANIGHSADTARWGSNTARPDVLRVDPRTFAERELQIFEPADGVVGTAEVASTAVVTPEHDAYPVHFQHLRCRKAQLAPGLSPRR